MICTQVYSKSYSMVTWVGMFGVPHSCQLTHNRLKCSVTHLPLTFFFFNYHHVKLAYKLVENRVLAFFLLPLQQMYNKKLADAPFLKEKTMKYWSKCQIKGQCLHEFCHQNVEFFFTLVVFVKHWSAMLMLIKDCGTQR